MFSAALQDDQWLMSLPATLGSDEQDIYIDFTVTASKPLRAADVDQVMATAWVRGRFDPLPQAVIYTVPDGRLFHVPLEAVTRRPRVEDAEEVSCPPPELLSMGGCDRISSDRLGAFGAKAEPPIQKWLLAAYHGSKL